MFTCRHSAILAALIAACLLPKSSMAAEKEGWSWKKMNPFRVDDTPLIRSPATRKIAPNRFKPTRSDAKPKKSVWKSMSDGSKKMADGTKKLFSFGDDKNDSARNPAAPILKPEPAKKKPSFTSWLPWSKTKKR